MKRFRQRKAFTIVEMVIVIAVIAILATVLVPTFGSIIQKANHSADTQFAASLNVQLAMWQVDHGEIANESDLRKAIDEFYGDGFYSELAPKSAPQGYYYWYDYVNGVVYLETVEGAQKLAAERLAADDSPVQLMSNKFDADGNPIPLSGNQNGKTFSPASLRTDLIDGLYLMGGKGEEGDLVDIITKFETLSGPQQYEDTIGELCNLCKVEAGKVTDPMQEAATALLNKVSTTTIITNSGAYRYEKLEDIRAIYVPMSVTYINVTTNVSVYYDDDRGAADPTEVALAHKDSDIVIEISNKDVVFGYNALPAIKTNNDILNYAGWTEVHVGVSTEAELKAMFSANSTQCVIVTPNGRFIIEGSEIHRLPLVREKDDEGNLTGVITTPPYVSDLGVHNNPNKPGEKPEINVDVTLTPNVNTSAGTDTIFFDTTSGTLYVAYNREGTFELKVGGGVPSSLLEWSVTDQKPVLDDEGNEVKVDGKTVFETVPSDWITLNGTTASINHNLEVGEDPTVTITVKVRGTDKSASLDVYLVRPGDVVFDLDKHTNISGTEDNSKENPNGFDLIFDGENYLFELKNANVQYHAPGKVKAETVSFSLKTPNFFELVTKDGKTYLQLKENLSSYNFSETLIATYGEFTVEFKLNMIDNSSKAFEKNWIVKDEVQMGKDYLFRVGNENAFNLGILFDNTKAANNIVLEIYDETAGAGSFMIGSDSAFKATVAEDSLVDKIMKDGKVIGWKLSSADWKNVTIKFTGKGVARIKIGNVVGDKYDGYEELRVEVVDGKNITDYSQLKDSGNNVLLRDITMSKDGSYKLSNGTLFGNGFTFDVQEATHAAGTVLTDTYVLSLNNYVLDNVKIIGKVYKSFNVSVKSEYNRPIILATGNSGIYNSYISNGSSPVRVSASTMVIDNTTLKGGSFANLDIRGGQITLRDVTTINQINANDKASDGSDVIGLGIVVWYETVANTTTVTVDGALTQYNTVSKAQTSGFTNEYAQKFVNEMFSNSALSAYRYNDGSTVWMNTGILSMTGDFGASNVTSKISGYSDPISVSTTVVITNYKGTVWTSLPTATTVAAKPNAWAPTEQEELAPTFNWDWTNKNYVAKVEGSNDYCYHDGSKVVISMDEGDVKEWDVSILTAKKLGENVSYRVFMNDVEYTGGKISFSAAGDYVVKFVITDPNNFDKSGNTYSKEYTKEVKISVSAVKKNAKPAEFTFGASNVAGTTVQIGNVTYVMPDVSATSTTIGSKTISGKTIYYPIVDGYTSDGKYEHSSLSSWYMCFPVFKNVITITDYADEGTGEAIVYNSSTTTLPAGLTAVTPGKTFIYDSASDAPTAPANVSGVLCYKSPTLSNNGRTARVVVAEYNYQDNAGNTYVYYVGYNLKETTVSSGGCVTPDTLVTLADGSQKMIKDVTYADKLLVWNFNTGKYDVMPASIVMNHGYGNYTVTTLTFSDGTTVNTINGHGFFDVAEMKYVIIDDTNAADYVGHEFVKVDGDGYTTVTLESFSTSEQYTESWSILTAGQYNCILENMWTLTPAEVEGSPDYLMPFEIGTDMKYDEAKMQADIEKYGLYTYEDFAAYCTYEQFVAFGFDHFKVSVEKGYITWDGIEFLLDLHLGGNK